MSERRPVHRGPVAPRGDGPGAAGRRNRWPSALVLLLSSALVACSGGRHIAPAAPAEVDLAAATPPTAAAADGSATATQATAERVPVGSDDAVSGAPDALVTVVEFTDYQCPFCARVEPTLATLRRRYPDAALRFVVKHNPLPFHNEARAAAIAAQAMLVLGGPWAFFAYSARLYDRQRDLSPAFLLREAARLDISRASFEATTQSPRVIEKVDADIALAAALGARGTPAFRINGVEVSGAQPLETFVRVIEDELAAAQSLVAQGVPRREVYARRVAENRPSETDTQTDGERIDETLWNVPIGTSPVRGPATALVTIVEFADFECPYCRQVQDTLQELQTRYPGELRFVFKHDALSFHDRAIPAAMLALEAARQQGNAGFWAASDQLWRAAPALEDGDLEQIARELGLNLPATRAALEQRLHLAVVEADQDLAADLAVTGTPSFFINGQRISGAHPAADFASIIDARLAEARALVAAGVAPVKVYDELMKRGRRQPGPELRSVPPPTADEPSRGPRDAPVVLTVFSDFQCPFCARVEPTLRALSQEFPQELRIVWRDLPLPFHDHARLAAEAAREAFRQRGDDGFWAMHDLLFLHQRDPDGLKLPALQSYADALGLDATRFAAALEHGVHVPAIEASAALADQAGIRGTPAVIINGYFISGAQELATFRRVVRRALAESRAPRQP